MKGHIRERSPGRWAIIIEMRDPETGRRKRKWHSFAGNKRQAQVECGRLVSAVKVGTYIEPGKTPLAQFLDRWLDDVRTASPRRPTNATPRSATRTSPRCSAPSRSRKPLRPACR
jgi:hypothetical protein